MHLVIVESPTKAKTIRKFLGPDYTILASMGHVRDLPQSAADIPEAYKKLPWANLGVNVDEGFAPLYLIPKNKTKTIQALKQALKEAEDVYLATDEDREGESISWHLLQVLKPKVPVRRMVFHEITRTAIIQALEHPRALDEHLVRAQETRRILDRLVGYTVSPVLWKKIAYGLSAGRVQSVALKALVERERSRMGFVKSAYWDVSAQLVQASKAFSARLVSTHGQRVAQGKDFDETTGQLKPRETRIIALDQQQAENIAREVRTSDWKVTDVQEKPVSRKPSPPFITSTFQQEANRKLGLSSKDAMRVAQGLYERGYITYMRTDSVSLSEEAIRTARTHVARLFGDEYLPSEARRYANTSKGAQEAHEAIRPSLDFTAPQDVDLKDIERDVYELIWMRTMASQMPDSQELQVSATLEVGAYVFQSSGKKILFPGFLRAYQDGSDDAADQAATAENILPPLRLADTPQCQTAQAVGHETKPPARFTEAALIQWMEKEGIGRPSTYANTISTLLDRGYARKHQNALIPTFTGMAVTQLLEAHFQELVDTHFTSDMEASLDKIASGAQAWLPYLTHFYLDPGGLRAHVEEKTDSIKPDEARSLRLPNVTNAVVHIGRFGPYFETTGPEHPTPVKASLPDNVAPADLTDTILAELTKQAQQGPTSLGQDPTNGAYIYLRTGSYGPYLQLGEDVDGKHKPKRISVPKNIPLDQLDASKALALLSLPRLLGLHPQSGKDIRAGLGRFGPYVVHDGDFRSLKTTDDVLTVSLERALELLAQPKGGRGRAAVLRTIGPHPDDQKPVTLHAGKFGPYVKHGSKNASLAKDQNPDTLTVEQATALLQAKKTKTRLKKSREAWGEA